MSAKSLVIWLVLVNGGLWAQTGSSTLLGTLTDPADALVPNATLSLTEQTTGEVHSATSNDAGLFRVLDLRPGRYALRVQASGFKALEIKDIGLASAENRDLGRLVMQIGAVTEEVSVTAQATPVQTASSERSALIDQSQLTQVALKGRDAFGYMRLIPGIVDTNPSRDLAGPGSSNNISINGMASNTKNVTFDGVTQLDQGGANAVYVSPNIDAIGEIKVLSSAYQAEFGRTAGGGINMVTKSGSTDFHGTGFWNRRHESLNANSFFNNRQGIQRPIYRYAIPGYSIGGPIFIPGKFNADRRRLFFFFSQEFTRVAQPTATSLANLPTTAERGGDFSKSLNSAGRQIPIIDPLNGSQFPNNIIPASRISPTGQAILNLFPLPNGYVNPAPGQQFNSNFLASSTPFYHRSDTILRVDWAVTNKMNMYARYGTDSRDQLVPFTVAPGLGNLVNFLPGYNWAGHITNTISPTMVNEVTIGVGHNNFGYYRLDDEPDSNYFRGSKLNPPTLRPFPTGPQYLNYLPAFMFAGGAAPNLGAFIPSYTGILPTNNTFPIPYKNFNDTYTVQDDLTKVIGSHSIKAGVYWEYNSKIEPARGFNYAGAFNFGSNVNNPLDTGHGYANALLGNFQTYTEGSNRLVPNPHFVEIEGYVQDNWRVNRRLTLDYGVRWYHVGRHTDDSNAYSGFYPELWDPKQAARVYRPATVGGKTVAQDPLTGATTFAALQNTLVPGTGSPVNGMRINGRTGNGDFYEFPFLTLSPRFGFAWDVFGNGKTAVRGSFGTFYSRPNANYISLELGAPPVVYTPVVYYSGIGDVAQAASSAAYSPTNAATAAGSQKPERNHQFNLTIQRDIGFGTVIDVGYVGNFDRHALQSVELNPVPQSAYANAANIFNNTEVNSNLLRTRYPGMGTLTYYSSGLSSLNYHGMQAQAQRRFSHGLQYGISYTFSKALGTCGNPQTNSSGCLAWDPYHSSRQWYYGPLPQDRTHVLAINYTYAFPKVPQNFGQAKHVLNDWVLSGITVFQTGAPVTPDCSSVSAGPANIDPSLTGLGAYSAANPTGARCQQTADPRNFTQSFFTNFNTGAFTLAAPGTFGNTGLGILRQPSWTNFDMTIEKRIRLGANERRVIRLRLEAYNVFNHTEFSTIGTSLQLQGAANVNTTWGQYTATQPQRQMSTTVRIEF